MKTFRVRAIALIAAILMVAGFPPAVSAGPQETAIAEVIARANAEQEQAIASHDPSVMRDTSGDSYYRDLSQANEDLLDSGAVAIKLVHMDWGPVSVNGASATATTYETWTTDYADGLTDQSRDRNVYSLSQARGVWTIQSDDHPDHGLPARPKASPTPPPSPSAPANVSPADESRNWAGYTATGGSFTSVMGTWTVPEPTTDGTVGIDAAWVGIGGIHGHDLIQAGTEQTVFASGLIEFETWIELLPAPSSRVPLAVHAGDSVTIAIEQQDDGVWLVGYKNNTTGATYRQNVFYDSSLSSAEWVEEAPSGGRSILPLDDFGVVEFTDVSAVKDHHNLKLVDLNPQAVTMANRQGEPLAVPSALTDDGAGFTVTRTSASAR